MTSDNYVSFEDAFNPKNRQITSEKSESEILKEVEQIINVHKGGKQNGTV